MCGLRSCQLIWASCLVTLLVACSNSADTGQVLVGQFGGGSFGTGGTFGATGGQAFYGTGGGLLVGSGGAVSTLGSGGDSAGRPASDLPCDIQDVLRTYCWKCHNNPPNWGGPMPLVTQADFLALGKVTTTMVVRDLTRMRINAATNAMPPISELAMPAEALVLLNTWLDAGTPLGEGSACATTAATGGIAGGTGGVEGGTVVAGDPYAEAEVWLTEPGWPGGVEPKETCYQFLKHGGQTPTDTSPHVTPAGEYYITFYYKVPWTEESVATKWRTVYDNTQILHHWLLYESSAATSKDGTSDPLSSASNLTTGLHVTGGNLVAGWAVGGRAETFPKGVGMQVPAPGEMFELEWHLYNSTGMDQADRSGIEICVAPRSAVDPKYIAGMTWLGTEDLVIPAGQTSKRGGVCTPSFKGGAPLTIISWIPHMHLLGVHMDTWVMHSNGTEDHIFNEAFQFDFQISHHQNPPYVVSEGDRLHSVCTFNNTTSGQVLFGQSTTAEMCYQFAMAYPAGSLDNGTVITGADNGCGLFPNDMSPTHSD